MNVDKPNILTSLNVEGPMSGTSFVKIGATSADFLKGDGSTSTGTGGGVIVREIDGTPSVSGVTTIAVSNGTLADNGAGQVTLTIAGATTLAGLTDTTITSNTSGEILKWNGSVWINNTLAEAGISATGHTHTLDGLSNVTITANSAGEILKWNGSAWINNTLAEAGISNVTNLTSTYTTTTIAVNSDTGTDVSLTGATASSAGIVTTGNQTWGGTKTAVDWTLSSDIRLKDNILPLSPENIDIQYVEYELKSDKGRKRYGVIAQDLELTNPELVIINADGFKSVSYIDLLIKEVAYLKEELKEIKKQINK